MHKLVSFKDLLYEFYRWPDNVTIVYCDTFSAICLSNNSVQQQLTKHIEIDILFVCNKVASGQVHILHVSFFFRYVDIFTKGFPSTLFLDFLSNWMSERILVFKQGLLLCLKALYFVSFIPARLLCPVLFPVINYSIHW